MSGFDFDKNSIDKLEQKKKMLEVEKLELENQKLTVEKDKLKLETQELLKPWFKKPQWWAVFIPLMIGAISIWVAFTTGIVGIQKLEKSKEGLESTISRQQDTLKRISDSLQYIKARGKEIKLLFINSYINDLNKIIDDVQKKVIIFREAGDNENALQYAEVIKLARLTIQGLEKEKDSLQKGLKVM